MIRISAIVEGHGEVETVPVLLRRLCAWLSPLCQIEVTVPIRIHRDRFLKRHEEFRKHLLLATSKSRDNGWILILLDADDDCPAKLGARILEQAKAVVPHRRVSVVLANREFEAWFIAAASSVDGQRGFSCPEKAVSDPDTIRNAKGWIGKQMPSGQKYREVTDQPAFAAMFDLELARNRSRSFRKLCEEWQKCAHQPESAATNRNRPLWN
ncbi:MAG: DUF4276 family protein [Gammaproteobacteria bacterium]|nr:DUF4276 family protein [Gammaproteobacteria bacterium]NNJ85470.1 DUF4276 family protein [Gammaproteobacteria bacterium]